MNSFKFLTPNKQPIRQWGGGDIRNNIRTIVYDLNGTAITILNEERPNGMNRIKCEGFAIKSFRWSHNFDHRLTFGENTRTNSEVYEGTIGRFFDTYRDRVINAHRRHARLTIAPVIERIDYSGSSFYTDTLKFSNGDMWVKIIYKKFYERV